MEGADLLSFRTVWFVLAGFILGFASSTLWEWLYYRRKRLAKLAQTSNEMFQPARVHHPLDTPEEALAKEAEDPWKVPYRSSGVFLESEQAPSPIHATSFPPTSTNQVEQHTTEATPLAANAPLTDKVDTPRLNPATLAALESTVTKLPIIHSPPVRTPANPQVYHTPTAQVAGMPTLAPTNAPATRIQSNAHHTQPTQEERSTGAALVISPTGSEENRDERPTPTVANRDAPSTATPTAALLPPLTMRNPGADTAKTDHPDDLALIKGVGEAYKRRLYGAGIYTWRQMAESDVEILRRITRAKPNADISGWRQRARDLAEQYHRWEAIFQGPLDDFTRIEGIGAITADTLYKAGICTYEQLAAALPDELAQIVPAPTVGDEIDFDGWINSAVRLANAKRRNQELLS
ncbi:MAG: helix-hairpin-helix domain-containing protein [Caldilineaceae bacterium]